MSLTDKAKNTAEKIKGDIKDKTGRATGDRTMEVEGKGDKVSGSLKNAGENVKDALKS